MGNGREGGGGRRGDLKDRCIGLILRGLRPHEVKDEVQLRLIDSRSSCKTNHHY